MKKSVSVIALLLTSSLLLAGCGGSDENKNENSSKVESKEKPDSKDDGSSKYDEAEDNDDSTEAPSSELAYTFDAPAGWEDATDLVSDGDETIQLAYMDDEGNSINVIATSNLGDVTDPRAEQGFIDELTKNGFSNVELERDINLDGEDFIISRANITEGSGTFFVHQLIGNHGEFTYVITTFSSDQALAEDVGSSVISSWKWN